MTFIPKNNLLVLCAILLQCELSYSRFYLFVCLFLSLSLSVCLSVCLSHSLSLLSASLHLFRPLSPSFPSLSPLSTLKHLIWEVVQFAKWIRTVIFINETAHSNQDSHFTLHFIIICVLANLLQITKKICFQPAHSLFLTVKVTQTGYVSEYLAYYRQNEIISVIQYLFILFCFGQKWVEKLKSEMSNI